MNSNPRLKVIELRNYLLKPGVSERFTNYFEDHFIDSQNVLRGFVLGQFRINGEDDRFFNLVADVELAQAFDSSILQLKGLDRNILASLDGRTFDQNLFVANACANARTIDA